MTTRPLIISVICAAALCASAGCGSAKDAASTEGQAFCSLPTNADVANGRSAYERWKTTLLTPDGAGGFLRVRRPNSKGAVVNSTVSEGIAYGMLLAVYMDDPATFDALWGYSQLHVDDVGLMNWYIGPTGEVLGAGGASDSDEDIAFALLQAAKKWGVRGDLRYGDLARKQIELVWQYEVEQTPQGPVLRPGDKWGGAALTNPSYFAPAFYRAFAAASGNQGWIELVDSSYRTLAASLNDESKNKNNGLVPAWCTAEGVPTHSPRHFQFDSSRTPFRIGQDYCWYKEPRAKEYLEKITGFYSALGLSNLVDGFDLDGTPRPEFSENGSRAAAFVGPAGVGAMFSPAHKDFVNAAYKDLVTADALIIGDPNHTNLGSIYYNTSWRALSLLMMDGTFVDLMRSSSNVR